MSSSNTDLQPYQCEFIDSVPEDFYCKKCTLVARELTVTNCCLESFCQTCIVDTREQGEPCPDCGEKGFTILQHVKNQKKIKDLQVYCSMKERGCVWSGTLDQLDTHLDPHLDNCQYVDTKCPLNCLQTLPKNKVDQHVAQECSKRPHVCQHCGFKASYEEIVNVHYSECDCVALQCPNMCGVSGEREMMEDHIKECRLEEVECEFSSVGCDGRFNREDQDEHARQNSQKHLSLTASLAVETNEQLQQKLLEQDEKHREEEEKLKKKIEEQERLSEEQMNKIEELEGTVKDLKETLKKMTERYNSRLNSMELTLQKVATDSNEGITNCTRLLGLGRRFVMENFSQEKAKDRGSDWKSPAMYTHVCGYKFCIGVYANGFGGGRGRSVYVNIWSMPGEFDHRLKWPTRAQFTIELLNQQGEGESVVHTSERIAWNKPKQLNHIGKFHRVVIDGSWAFMKHSEVQEFLSKDSLHFLVCKVDM